MGKTRRVLGNGIYSWTSHGGCTARQGRGRGYHETLWALELFVERVVEGIWKNWGKRNGRGRGGIPQFGVLFPKRSWRISSKKILVLWQCFVKAVIQESKCLFKLFQFLVAYYQRKITGRVTKCYIKTNNRTLQLSNKNIPRITNHSLNSHFHLWTTKFGILITFVEDLRKANGFCRAGNSRIKRCMISSLKSFTNLKSAKMHSAITSINIYIKNNTFHNTIAALNWKSHGPRLSIL